MGFEYRGCAAAGSAVVVEVGLGLAQGDPESLRAAAGEWRFIIKIPRSMEQPKLKEDAEFTALHMSLAAETAPPDFLIRPTIIYM